jgi:hypothetical protein
MAAAVLAVPTSPAMAAGWLSKSRAHAKTVSLARDAYLDLDFATSYSVEPSYRCSRHGYSVVDCDWKLYGDGIVCDSTTRVRLTSYGYLSSRFPYGGHCRSTGYSAPSYTPPSYTPPTTGNFGNGTGTVAYCNDGTLSDSIGRPGACSWHGGVAP